jgi:hypothetical protein
MAGPAARRADGNGIAPAFPVSPRVAVRTGDVASCAESRDGGPSRGGGHVPRSRHARRQTSGCHRPTHISIVLAGSRLPVPAARTDRRTVPFCSRQLLAWPGTLVSLQQIKLDRPSLALSGPVKRPTNQRDLRRNVHSPVPLQVACYTSPPEGAATVVVVRSLDVRESLAGRGSLAFFPSFFSFSRERGADSANSMFTIGVSALRYRLQQSLL